jgi:hypothetical protein
VQVKARMLVEPCRHLGMPMGGIVVEHEVEIEFWRGVAVDGPQEAQELLMAVALHALPDHRSARAERRVLTAKWCPLNGGRRSLA